MTKLLISLVLGSLTLAAAGVSDAPKKTCCPATCCKADKACDHHCDKACEKAGCKTCCDKPKAEHDKH
ncbi:MAG: hypothetical protein HGA66_14105 [Holophaga sp.]|nr:hypothetical protein [Holophaga sp.]